MMQKKGEKSLQMIFGLFILLIISLVVLSLFFKFTEHSGSAMTETSDKYFSKAAIQDAIEECNVMCEDIKDLNGAIEFCKKYQRIDWDGDKVLQSKISRGQWDFCEDKIPCFVLTDNCKDGTYDGERCNQILCQYRQDAYAALYNEPAATTPDAGTCGLEDVNANWKRTFGFDVTCTTTP